MADVYISQLLTEEQMKQLCSTYDAGIETIEFSIGENLDQRHQKVECYRQQQKRIQPVRLGVHGPFLDLNPASYDSLVAKATMQRYTQAYESAVEIGADYILFHTCYIPATNYLIGWPERVATFFKEFIEKNNVSMPIYLENVFDTEAAPMLEIVERVNNPLFGICLDVGHVNAFSKTPVEQWIKQLGKWIRHVHIHNNDGTRDAHQPLDQGSMDMKKIFELLEEYADIKSMTIEHSKYEDAIRSLEFLKEILKK